MIISPTVDHSNLSEQWNAIVIGAGPSGAIAAAQLALQHKKVLLIDKMHFPRAKVCGCCVNKAAADALLKAGLYSILKDSNANPIREIEYCEGHKRVLLPLSGGSILSRDYFDAELVKAAIERGADFLPGHSAKVLSLHAGNASVRVQLGDSIQELQAKIVIVADGLSGHTLDNLAHFSCDVERGSRFGAGALLLPPTFDPAHVSGLNDQTQGCDVFDYYKAGRIYMSCSEYGYVGVALLEDGRIDVAAALDRDFSRAQNGPAQAAAAILRSADLPIPNGLEAAHWMGTDSLTRRRRNIAGTRLFVVGDAAGYAEPFTGEGIAWALWSGLAASSIAARAVIKWNDHMVQEWEAVHADLIRRRHKRSKLISKALRSETVRKITVGILASIPSLANPILSSVSVDEAICSDYERVTESSIRQGDRKSIE